MLYAPSYVPPCASFYAPLIIVLYSKFNLHILKLQWCLTLCNPMDCSPPDSSVPGTLQARILEWVAIPPPGDLPDPGIEPRSLMSPTLAGGFLTPTATWEAPQIPLDNVLIFLSTFKHALRASKKKSLF